MGATASPGAHRADIAAGQRPWRIAWLLTACYVLSFVDRYLISLVADPIKQSFGLSDLQLGLLMGPAFGILYAAFGIPFGLAADRFNRRLLIIAGITFWCVMTAMCGLATSFIALFAARLAVGVGEASLTPAALSIISDVFAPTERARAIGLYMASGFFGAAIAFAAGGSAADWLARWTEGGAWGGAEGWRLLFIAAGFSGLIVVMLFAIGVKEPPRCTMAERAEVSGGVGLFQHLSDRAGLYATLVGAMSCVFLLGYVIFWFATYFTRTWGWQTGEAGVALAALLIFAGLPGSIGAGAWVSRRLAGGKTEAPAKAMVFGLAVMTPCYAAFPWMPSALLSVLVAAGAMFGQAAATAAGPVAVVQAAPDTLRATLVALFLTVSTVFGALAGPSLVGWVSDAAGGSDGLSFGISVVSLASGIIGTVMAALTARVLRQQRRA